MNTIKCQNNNKLENTNASILYYFTNEEISTDHIINELKEWTRTGTLNEDELYDSMMKKLDIIKNNITWSKHLSNDNVELCSKGLELSINLCNYCIDKEYHTSKYVKSQTKYYFDYFTEQLEHWIIFNTYKECECLEKNGLLENAIEKYLDLLNNHIPLGSVYYESPFYLSIKILDYGSAFRVYNILKNNFNKTNNKTLENTLDNIEKIIHSLKTDQNMYPQIKNEIFSILKDNPNILQSDLYKNFDSSYKESLRFIIYNLEKYNIIKREKKGRSYTLSLNN